MIDTLNTHDLMCGGEHDFEKYYAVSAQPSPPYSQFSRVPQMEVNASRM
jgi:hypothetical protein